MKNKLVFFIAVFCFFVSDGWAQENLKEKIVGKWCNPYTYKSTGELKGFHFKKGGVCEAINIPSLELKTWEVRNDSLIIKGLDIQDDGSKVPYQTEERIGLLTADSLSLVTQDKPRIAFLYLNAKTIKEKVQREGGNK